MFLENQDLRIQTTRKVDEAPGVMDTRNIFKCDQCNDHLIEDQDAIFYDRDAGEHLCIICKTFREIEIKEEGETPNIVELSEL